MKALVVTEFVTSYDNLKPSEVATPIAKGDEVLVAISHAGVNYVDLLYCRGKHQNNRSLVRPPFILGLEFAGTVLSCPISSNLKVGDHVFGGGLGGFAEMIAVKESTLMRVPQAWSLREAAGMAATAPVSYGALVRIAKVKAGETVLVHAAAGGLGIMAVQIAMALGARVVATVGSLEKEQVVKNMGVKDVINYNTDGWERLVMAATGGEGIDVTFDPVGLVEKSIRCSKYAARIVIVGFAGREGDLEGIAANRILLKSITIHGYVCLKIIEIQGITNNYAASRRTWPSVSGRNTRNLEWSTGASCERTCKANAL